MHIYAMRHGESEYNVKGLCNDDPGRGVHLTRRGRLQAEEAAAALRRVPLDQIFCSELPRARETAARVARRTCDGEGVQFLDDTVALAGLRAVLDHGRPAFRRVYAFEFSRAGNDRHGGSVTLTGARVETVFLSPDAAT